MTSMQPCSLLPPSARNQLIKAAEIKDPRERERAINETVARLKVKYPQFFRQTGNQNDHQIK